MRGDTAFTYMVNLLSGKKYDDYITLLIADEVISTVGARGDTTQHLLLSTRLYTPTVMENFANV
jgi:hypothetical protein